MFTSDLLVFDLHYSINYNIGLVSFVNMKNFVVLNNSLVIKAFFTLIGTLEIIRLLSTIKDHYYSIFHKPDHSSSLSLIIIFEFYYRIYKC